MTDRDLAVGWERRLRAAGFFLAAVSVLLMLAGTALAGQDDGVNASGARNGRVAVDPVTRPDAFSAVLYDNRNGLPTSEANAIATTSEGFLWIGSYSGLIRYDGSEFIRIDSTTGIAGVKSLYTDSQDRLWIGTNDSGLALMYRGEIRKWDKRDGLRSNTIRAIAEATDGTIYIASTGGVDYLDRDMQLHSLADERLRDAYIYDLRVGNDGLLYGLTEEGDIFTLRNRALILYLSRADNCIGKVDCMIPDPANAGWVYAACEGSRICHGRPEDNFRNAEYMDVQPLGPVQNLEYIDGKLWVCARNGIGVADGTGFHAVENVPINNSVGHVMADYEGNLWFTSTRQGVMKMVPNAFSDLYERYGLTEEVVNTTCLYGSQLFIGSDNGLRVLGEDGPVESIPLTKAETASGEPLEQTDLLQMLDGTRIRSIIRDSRGRLWISTWRSYGLLRYDRGELIAFTTKDGMLSKAVRAVYERKDGSMLVALSGGVNIIEGDRVTGSYGEENGIANTESLTVAEGLDGEIVLGTDGGGLYLIRESGITHIGIEEGISSEIIMRAKPDQERGVIWLITGNSISWLDEEDQVHTVSQFPYSNNFDLYWNARGDMWVLSSNGIYVVPAEDLLENREITPVYYSIANGLPCTATGNSYSELTEEGDLYIAGRSGAARVNISSSLENTEIMKAAVPFLDVDGTRVYPEADGCFAVAAEAKRLTVYAYVFNYALSDPQVTCHLEGFEKQEVTVRRSELDPVAYTNVPGGTYEFVMVLRDAQGRGGKTVTVQIMKARAFYEQTWFYLAVGLALALILTAGIRLYLRRKMAEMEKKNQEEKEKERLNTELTMASRIQEGVLPSTFPPFPDRKEFDVFASMNPAKEVGGDFYDFFLIDEDHLCLVIADVSGKGVPGALFMMVSKVILENSARMGRSAAEILSRANESICANNKMQMFVTVWLGILEISTGRITAASAGHEYPAICRKDGTFELFRDKHGLVIGAMEGVRYREYELRLQPGDRVFVYTDGIPEATNRKEEMFGTDRMIDALNRTPGADLKEILDQVRTAVDAFVGDMDPFDDMTMMCLEYLGPEREKEGTD